MAIPAVRRRPIARAVRNGVGKSRTPRAISEKILLDAALATFVEKGFHGTSMRDIAARAGTSVSHAYYYFPAKRDILWRIMAGITRELIAALTKAADRGGADPAMRLAAIVRAHVLLHTRRQDESFVGNTELRSLGSRDRRRLVALRDRVSSIFKAAIGAGLRRKVFSCDCPAEANLAIVTMCTSVADWYRANGRISPDEMADRYAALALRMVGYMRPAIIRRRSPASLARDQARQQRSRQD